MSHGNREVRIATARQLFYKNRRCHRSSTCTASFERLLELFADETISMTKVAAKIGITRGSATRLYDRYFCELLSHVPPVERREIFFEAQKEARRQRMAETIRDLPWFDRIDAGAKKAGLVLSAHIPTDCNGKLTSPRKTLVEIGGMPCAVHPIRVARKPSAHSDMHYGIVRIPSASIDEVKIRLFPVVISGAQGTFVIPTKDLVEGLAPREQDRDHVHLYIPLRRFMGPRRCPPRIDFWPYRDAWHLLSAA